MATVTVTSEKRVFPASGVDQEHTVPLSILDATVANFTPTEVVLTYDAPAPTPSDLLNALERVLDAYPQWTGHLHQRPFNPATRRLGRLALTWGRPDDPGAAFVEARCDTPLAAVSPARRPDELSWDPSAFPAANLLPHTPLPTPLAPDADSTPPRPALLIQLTTFPCASLALGIRLAHPLADAHTLSHFLHDWATLSCSLPLPALPLFAPSTLDSLAAPLPPSIPSAPCSRFDWWIFNPHSPFPARHPPAELLSSGLPLDPPATPMPWHTWNPAAPVAHRVLRFLPSELRRLHAAATADSGGPGSDNTLRISHLDALLAHLWSRITFARGGLPPDAEVTLHHTLNLRARFAPPLPDAFVGSPLLLAAATAPAADVIASAAGAARTLRAAVNACGPQAVAGHVWEREREQCPQRVWGGFLGSRNLIVTAWVGMGVWGVRWGEGGRGPRGVWAGLPGCDGLVGVVEAGPGVEEEEGGQRRHWVDCGVDVQVILEEGAMVRLLADGELRKFSHYTGNQVL